MTSTEEAHVRGLLAGETVWVNRMWLQMLLDHVDEQRKLIHLLNERIRMLTAGQDEAADERAREQMGARPV